MCIAPQMKMAPNTQFKIYHHQDYFKLGKSVNAAIISYFKNTDEFQSDRSISNRSWNIKSKPPTVCPLEMKRITRRFKFTRTSIVL